MAAAGRCVFAATLLLSAAGHADPATMPLLGDARIHLYTQRAYEDFGPAVEAAVDSRYDALVSAGMDTARHLFDWRDLEPDPGVYDTGLVIEAMESVRARGIVHQFPNLVVLDSSGPMIPAYVEALLDGGAAWDDPRITRAFADLLDVYVPLMLGRGMFMLGLSNEPGGYYEDEPAAAASFAGFVEAAVAHAHGLAGDLALTVAFAGPDDPAIPALLPLCDVATFNTYIYFPEVDPACRLNEQPLALLRSDGPASVGTYLDALIAAADGKLINIQEIGQASTGASLGAATSEAHQAAVYEALVAALDSRRAHFRTVCNWTLNDHAEAWLPLGRGLREEGLPACFAENVVESFTATGLVRSDARATPKPAFAAFEAGVRFFAGSAGSGAFEINQGLAGAWFDPATPGQGFLLDVEPESRFLFLAWFTFPARDASKVGALDQRWLTAQGTYAGAFADSLVLSSTTGGRFDDPRAPSTAPVGELSLRFAACDRGVVDYTFEDGPSGRIELERLVPGSEALCEALADAR